MNLSDLARHANAGRIDALELISLEGGIYILDIYLQGQRHALVDERGSVCHLRSVEHARDLLLRDPLARVGHPNGHEVPLAQRRDQHLAAGPFGGLVLQTDSPRLGTGG